MLYNKNSVRKTNDKKILHKVGKQWKVVSVALLMAIGGGAAVAATNNANANADANNGVTQETQATVNSLEQGPQIGQSSAPASASSKASSASSAAPVMPKLSLNPDPSLNGNNASAELARVTQGYDNAVVKFYGNKVQSYVNFVNSNYSASANSVNSNYASASNKQSSDVSSANSFSAVAAGKNWSAEVNNIASAKSGVTGSEFIDAVENNTKHNSASVSSANDVASDANSVVSAVQLLSNVVFNGERTNYAIKAQSAAFASQSANMILNYETNALNLASENSVANQEAYTHNFASSEVLSLADSAALQNASADINTTSSLASQYKISYASASSEVSAVASAEWKPVLSAEVFKLINQPNTPNNNDNGLNKLNTAVAAANEALRGRHLNNRDKAIVNNANAIVEDAKEFSNPANVQNEVKKVNNQSTNTAVNTIVNDLHLNLNNADKNALIAKAEKYVALPNNENVNAKVNPDGSVSINGVSFNKDFIDSKLNNAASSAASDLNNLVKSVKGKKSMTPKQAADAAATKADKAANTANTRKVAADKAAQQHSGNTKLAEDAQRADRVAQQANANKVNADKAAQQADAAANPNGVAYNGPTQQSTNTVANNDFDLSDPAINQLLLDTAVQQNYGALKSSCDNAMNSAKAASASDAAAVTSASAAMTSASAKNASASSAYQSAAVLANAGKNGNTLFDDVQAMVKPSKNDFYSFNVKKNNVITADVHDALNVNYNAGSKAVSGAVSAVASLANDAGSVYTSASNASENYAKSTDANFVLANVYANSYEAMSSSDNSAFNSASAARANFYNTYAGSDFASDNAQLTNAKADEPNQGALANGYARYVQIHEPHVVTVTKQLVMHANPNYNDKTDTPADAKLAVINKGTHLLVENVGFDKHGNTRLYVNYNGKKGFITGLRNYVADSYLVPGEKYSVTFGRTANQYKGLQFNKANATKFSVKAGQTVTGTAVLNDDPHYWNGLTRLQLSNGNFVTTLDSYIKSATPLNGQSTQQSKGAYFWNGQDNTFKNVTK